MVGQERDFGSTLHLNYCTAGSRMATAKIAIGTSISIKVKPRRILFFMTFSFRIGK